MSLEEVGAWFEAIRKHVDDENRQMKEAAQAQRKR